MSPEVLFVLVVIGIAVFLALLRFEGQIELPARDREPSAPPEPRRPRKREDAPLKRSALLCGACHAPITDVDQFCTECGTPIARPA